MPHFRQCSGLPPSPPKQPGQGLLLTQCRQQAMQFMPQGANSLSSIFSGIFIGRSTLPLLRAYGIEKQRPTAYAGGRVPLVPSYHTFPANGKAAPPRRAGPSLISKFL